MERRRKIYRNLRIQDALIDESISCYDMLPSCVVELLATHEERYGLYATANYLPLETFDDEEFDCRSVSSTFHIKNKFIQRIKSIIISFGVLVIAIKFQYTWRLDKIRNNWWHSTSTSGYDLRRKICWSNLAQTKRQGPRNSLRLALCRRH